MNLCTRRGTCTADVRSSLSLGTHVRLQDIFTAVGKFPPQSRSIVALPLDYPAQEQSETAPQMVGLGDTNYSPSSVVSSLPSPSNHISKSPQANNAIKRISINLEKRAHELGCLCSCHAQTRSKRPFLVHAILGMLFSGYHISPWPTVACDSTYCANKCITYTYQYTFPQWLTNRMILIAMAQSSTRGR